MYLLRVVWRIVRFLVVLVAALLLSTVLHLDTSIGRRAGRVLVNVLVTDLIAGRLEVGRIDRLRPDRIVIANASLYDPHGRRVIQADRIVLVLDVGAALDGTLRFSHAELHRGYLRLEESPVSTLTFLEALGSRHPSTEETPPGEAFHAIVDDMRLHELVAYGSMLGATGLHGRDLHVHMRMEFHDEMDIRVFGGHGLLDGPQDYVATLDDVTARVSSLPHVGSTVDARAHYEDQRLRAHLRYAVPEERPIDSPPELELILHVDPIDMATVARLGFDWAGLFHGRGSGYVRLYGPSDALRLSAALQHEAGPLVLRGRLPSEGDVEIEASTPGIDLARLVPDTPSMPLGGDVSLTIHPSESGQPSTVHAQLNAFAFEGFAIPTLTVDATLLDDRVRLDHVEAPYGRGGELHVDGYATYEGDAHVEVAGSLGEIGSDPNVQRYADGARGRATVRATVERDASSGTLRVDARGRIDGLTYSDVQAAELRYSVEARTSGASSRLSVEADAIDLRVGPIMLGDGTASIHSAGNGYAIDGSFLDPRVNGRTSVAGRIVMRDDDVVLDAPRLSYERRGVRLELDAQRIELAPHRIFSAERLRLRIDDAVAARMDARWTQRGSDSAQLVLDGIPLASLSRLFAPMLPELDGVLRGTAALSGDLESDPIVELEGRIENGRVRTLDDVSGSLAFRLDRGVLSGALDLDAAQGGHVAIDLSGRAPITMPNFSNAIREGEYDFHGRMESIDVGLVAAGLLGTTDAGVTGCMDGELDFGGYVAFAPTLEANVSVGDLQIAGSPPFELAVLSKYDGQNLEISASVGADTAAVPHARSAGRCRESAGTRLADAGTYASEGLAEAYGNLQIPLVELFGPPEQLASELQLLPWGLSVRVPPRRIATLPAAWRTMLPASMGDFQAAASFSALGGFGTVQASAAATLDYVGDTNRFVCGRGSRPRVSFWGTHVAGDTRGRISAFVGPERVMSALVRTALPVDEWLAAGAIGSMPPTSIDAAITPVDYESLGDETPPPVESSRIPFLCEYFTGPFAGTAEIDDLFTDTPTVAGSIASSQLQFRRIERSIRGTVRNALEETPVIPNIALKFAGDSRRLSFNHDMTWWGEQTVSQITGYVDWLWDAANPVPLVADDAPFDLRLDAPLSSSSSEPTMDDRIPSQLPLQMLAGWIPIFGRVEGDLEAQVHATGTLNAPQLSGRLRISEGTLVIAGIGQRLRNVRGVIDLEGSRAIIRDLTARDEDGTAHVDGDVTLVGWSPTQFQLRASADSFPVRDEGSIIARLSGHAGLQGELLENRATSELTIADLDVALAPTSSQNPIALGEHPDVRIVGLAAAPVEEAVPYPLHVHLLQTPRFWVRSEDFSAQVSTELDVTYDDPDVRILGSLEMHRGFFEVFGKRFEVEQGSMVFDGGRELDPIVSLVATHQLRGGGRNDIVVVRAGGTLSAPTIEFSSPLVATGDQGQILCVLMTGSSSGQCGESSSSGPSPTASDASNQAAQFLTGVAFGVATLALREQFGEFIPMLAIENNGTRVGSTRVRAGFNIDRIIPERLRRIVRGIYIEGYVSTSGSGTAQTTGTATNVSPTSNAQYGVSLELQFPHNIVTQGEYAQNSSWRLGVTWEP